MKEVNYHQNGFDTSYAKSHVYSLYATTGDASTKKEVNLAYQLPVSITTKVLSLNPTHGKVYSIQHYVIRFGSDLQQVDGFLRFPPPIKITATI
jgi:hypothetical protein